ncbi:MAG: Gfo/Idh/MocA family oxidoreductase [Arcobacteraceae bacterium]|nr:Gfo/Idh/MocA family oxidoreductase [Arcobacteraceae bacterium]
MKRIALVGAGQLGSRHLQGLAKCNINISIEVVEPFESSRNTAKQRFEEIPKNDNIKQIDFYEKISQLSDELDLVIVATNADVRYKVIDELLKNKNIKNLVLEKVLFQKINEYHDTLKLLEETKTKCWVNHPRRMFPFYQNLKQELSNATKIHFSVSGSLWGLGCNGLHLFDCIEYLSDSAITSIDTKYIDNKLYDTKRTGFKEINGLIIGYTENNNLFTLNCFEGDLPAFQFNITSNDINITIDELAGWYRVAYKNNNFKYEPKEEKIVYFQSELTNVLLEDILCDKCVLPTYETAMALHIKYLDSVIEKINSFSEIKYDFCPIT